MAEEQKPQNYQINTFTKGLVTDLDNNLVPNENWIAGLNFRIMNKDGQGFVITNAESNELAFSLRSGFTALGSVEYNGILYIASTDGTTGEIGCYPSVDFSTNSTVWEHTYRALYNYDTGTIGELRTTLFNFSLEHQVSMLAKPSFDGSVDLFLCDYYNPNRVINTGFKQSGELTGRVITPESFNTWLNQVMGTNETPLITLNSIESGGSLKYGNYFFFLRYVTSDLDKTHFVAESNACQIYSGELEDLYLTEGGNGGLGTTSSDKKVILDITNLDTSYSFLEVGYIRYYSDPNGEQTFETGLVNKRYDFSTASTSIEITGTEGSQTLTLSEIITPKSNEDRCKDHTQVEDRYFGANWKGRDLHHQALAEFAMRTTINYDDSLTIDGNPLDPNSDITVTEQGQYKDYAKTYDYVGYFRGEAYNFQMIFELTDGSITEAYPMIGHDYINGTSETIATGTFRFPNTNTSNIMTGEYNVGLGNRLKIMGIKFNITNSVAWVNNAGTDQDWFNDNVRAFYFVRSERYETLQYQGVMMHCSIFEILDDTNNLQYKLTYQTTDFSGADREVNHGTFTGGVYQHNAAAQVFTQDPYIFETGNPFWGAERSTLRGYNYSVAHYDKYYPVWRGYMPMHYFDGVSKERNYVSRWFAKKNKYAFYSPDFLIQSNNYPLNCNYIKRVANTINPNVFDYWTKWKDYNSGAFVGITDPDIYPRLILNEVTKYDYLLQRDAKNFKAKIVGELNFSKPSGSDSFVNYSEGGDNVDTLMYFAYNVDGTGDHWYNRQILSPKYISIDLDNSTNEDTYVPDLRHFSYNIVNLYSQKPEDISFADLKKVFNKTTLFAKISEPITDWNNYNNNTIYYKGDCFLQRSYFKQAYWRSNNIQDQNIADDGDVSGNNKVYWTHGNVVGIVTENKYNVAMRMLTDNGNTYYPHETTAYDFVYTMYSNSGAESFWYNNGYHKTLSPATHLQHDDTIPTKDYTYPVRIRYSEQQVPGEIANSYRKLLYANYRDYDLQFGPINAITELNGWLCSIQNDSINRHYVNEKQIQEAGLTGALVLGTGAILPSQFTRLANFGSQHQWSVTKIGNNRYGVDWNKRCIWRLGYASSDARGMYPVATNLTKEKLCEKWIYNLFDLGGATSDITATLPDNPIFLGGINSGCDKKYNEINFSFHLNKIINGSLTFVNPLIIDPEGSGLVVSYMSVPDTSLFNIGDEIYIRYNEYYCTTHPQIIESKIVNIDSVNSIIYLLSSLLRCYGSDVTLYLPYGSSTMCFGEDLDIFLNERSYCPSMYYNINKDFFSSNIISSGMSDDIYRHNVQNSFLNYYGTQYPRSVTFAVNGNNPLTKVYDSMIVDCYMDDDYYLFDSVSHETLTQTSIHTPLYEMTDPSALAIANRKNWIDPRYKEDKMYMPVKAEEVGTVYRQIRGAWMLTTLVYDKNQSSYLKNVITKFRISNS